MKRTLGFILVLFLSVLLYACGGGGGSGGNGIALPTTPVTITQQNAPQVAGAAFDTFNGGASMPVAAKNSAPAGGQSATSAAKTIAGISRSAAQQIIAQGTVTATKAASTTYCTYGGTLSVSSTGPTSGIGTYSNCSMVAGETINGTVSINNIVSTATTISFSTVVNLTIATVSPANTQRSKGDMSLSFDISGAMTMSGTSLAMGNSDAALGNFGLRNYWIAFDSTGAITAMTFTFASTAIGGTASFAMTTQFARTTLASLFPSSGVAIITGADQTVLRLTVLGDENAVGNQVQLELSIDGGATYASPTYHTWAEMSSQI